jgi:hypothetical protein
MNENETVSEAFWEYAEKWRLEANTSPFAKASHAFRAGWQGRAEHDGWVDVNERLPTSSGYYLLSLTPSDFHQEVEAAYFQYSSKGWCRTFGASSSHYFDKREVIAWMPLPPPFAKKDADRKEGE